MALVSDCRALAEAQPVEVTKARMPWFISSQAVEGEVGWGGWRGRDTDDVISEDKDR